MTIDATVYRAKKVQIENLARGPKNLPANLLASGRKHFFIHRQNADSENSSGEYNPWLEKFAFQIPRSGFSQVLVHRLRREMMSY